MKRIFIRLLIWYENDFSSFNVALAALLAIAMIITLQHLELPRYLSIIIFFLAVIFLLLTNYVMDKITNRYIVKIPSEKDCDCEGLILMKKNGEVLPMSEKSIFSPGGSLKKVKSSSPSRRGKWTKNQEGVFYSFPITIGEITFEECREEVFIKFFMDAERKFNLMEIYNIYQQYNLDIIDDCLYIEDALRASIIKLNEDNEKLKIGNLHLDEDINNYLQQNLLTPRLSGVKSFGI